MKTNVMVMVLQICLVPFVISLVYGMYRLTCISDYYLIWMLSSAVVMVYTFWATAK